MMISDIAPKFGIKPLEVTIKWNELDAMTAKEQAEINRFKAETGKILVETGAIDGYDELNRIISDKHSGYSGVVDEDSDPIEQIPSSNIGA